MVLLALTATGLAGRCAGSATGRETPATCPRHRLLLLTDLGVEEDTSTTGVEPCKLGEVVDDAVNDDPEVAGLVVLCDASAKREKVKTGWVSQGAVVAFAPLPPSCGVLMFSHLCDLVAGHGLDGHCVWM